MKSRFALCLSTLIFSVAPATLLAQDYAYHPALSDGFTASLGTMRSSNSFKMSSDVFDGVGDEIDFDDSLDVSGHSTFFNGQLRWKFGGKKKWSLAAQYFSNSATGSAILDEDIEWEGLTFQEGTFAEAGVKMAVTRVFTGRSFFKNEQNDFGLGIGIHNLDLSAYIKGEVIVNGETTGEKTAKVSGSQILPNIGGWYLYSPAKNWLLHSRVDWISANIGDYDGGLWNISAGVGYQAWRHVGFDLSWQYFNLHLDIDSDDWIGGAKMTYSGPVVSMTFGW